MSSQKWLLKFGLAGVQEFISHARKIRDLAAASSIISGMARAAAEKAENCGGTRLLPAELGKDCPHQIVVEFTAMDEKQLPGKAMAEAARRYLAAKVADLPRLLPTAGANSLRTSLGLNGTSAEQIRERLEPLVNGTVESYWVAVRLTDEKTSFAELLRAFDDRRHSRTFSQLPTPKRLVYRTCSVCGIRPSVIRPPEGDWPKNAHFFSRRDEHLCAVCAIKRAETRGAGGSALSSTHSLARDRFFRYEKYRPLATALEAAGLAPESHRWFLDDLDMLLAENPPDRAMQVRSEVYAAWAKIRPKADDKSDEGGRLVRLAKDVRAQCYYAVVLFDGDEMGKWFSGEYWPGGGALDLRRAREALSGAITGFADGVRQAANGMRAEAIYLGGDDGLLFCPLDMLFRVIKAIQDNWSNAIGKVPPGEGGRTQTLTLHASVVHAKQPLQPVVAEAHRYLEMAKDEGGRNCFSVLVRPHSGSSSHMLAEWSELDALTECVEALGTWRRCDAESNRVADTPKRAMAIPRRLVETCIREMDAFFDPTGRFVVPAGLVDAFGSELERLFDRSGAVEAGAGAPSPEHIRDWLGRRAVHRLRSDGRHYPLLSGREAYRSALEVSAFLSRVLG